MTSIRRRSVRHAAAAPLATALLAALLALPAAHADSSTSSVSSAGSRVSGSLSDSVQGSSDSSSRDDRKVAEGRHRIVGIGDVEGHPELLRLALRFEGAATGEAAGATWHLRLPRAALDGQPLAVGAVITARHRAYGIEFARAESREAFFLALDDAWQRELAGPRPVTL